MRGRPHALTTHQVSPDLRHAGTYSPPGTACSTWRRRSGPSRRTAWKRGEMLVLSWRPRRPPWPMAPSSPLEPGGGGRARQRRGSCGDTQDDGVLEPGHQAHYSSSDTRTGPGPVGYSPAGRPCRNMPLELSEVTAFYKLSLRQRQVSVLSGHTSSRGLPQAIGLLPLRQPWRWTVSGAPFGPQSLKHLLPGLETAAHPGLPGTCKVCCTSGRVGDERCTKRFKPRRGWEPGSTGMTENRAGPQRSAGGWHPLRAAPRHHTGTHTDTHLPSFTFRASPRQT